MKDDTTQALAVMGQFIAEGIIHETKRDKWRLTDKGVEIALNIFNNHTHREQVLLLLYCRHKLDM